MSDINIVLEQRDDIRVAVEEKDINVEVPAGKDGRSLRPRGEWSASAAYAYLDLVSYEGSSYVALKAVPAGTLPTDTSYWMLSAEKGGPGTPVWGTITGDLSDQTDLQTALDAKADVIISSASGSIASFTDGFPAPVTALSVGIEPVQDLHGYDNPWPAGGGKNLYNPSAIQILSHNGVTLAISDGVITMNGTAETGNSFFNVTGLGLTSTNGFSWSANNSETNSGVHIVLRDSNGNYFGDASLNKTNKTSYQQSQNDCNTVTIYVTAGTQLTNFKVKPQVEKGPATSYAPCSNICPISGHTSATVTRTGKNLLQTTATSSGIFTVNADGTINVNGTSNGNGLIIGYVTPTQETTYKLNGCPSGGGDSTYRLDARLVGASSPISWSRDTGSGSEFTASKPFFVFLRSPSGVQISNKLFKPMIRLASDPDDTFEPYQAQQVTIDLDGTRYGGTLNVLTGEMTVTKVMETYDGTNKVANSVAQSSLSGNWYAILQDLEYATSNTTGSNLGHVITNYLVEGETPTAIGKFSITVTKRVISVIPDQTIQTKSAYDAYLAEHPLQVCYPLATPLTVQLTPSQISTLLGQNNVWADTGDVAVTYRADTKLYIDGVASATAKVTRQMIADSATADGKAPKSLATGDLIIVGDELRKATANIGNGSAITASNSNIATLADVIKALQ